MKGLGEAPVSAAVDVAAPSRSGAPSPGPAETTADSNDSTPLTARKVIQTPTVMKEAEPAGKKVSGGEEPKQNGRGGETAEKKLSDTENPKVSRPPTRPQSKSRVESDSKSRPRSQTRSRPTSPTKSKISHIWVCTMQ